MAELTPKQLSDLSPVAILAGGTLFYVCPENALTDSGYDSNYITAMDMLTSALKDIQFPLVFTKTTAKTPAGAINELAPVKVTGTLLAGNTSITLSDPAISTSSKFKFYSDKWGLYPTAKPVTVAGSITLAFEAQPSNVAIIVEVYS